MAAGLRSASITAAHMAAQGGSNAQNPLACRRHGARRQHDLAGRGRAGTGPLGRCRRSGRQSARLRRRRRRGRRQGLRRRPAHGRSRPRRPGDHADRRAQADRHRLLRRDDAGHAAGGRGAGQRPGHDRRPDRGQHRRPDHLHRQLHHPGRRRHPVRRQRPGGDRAGAEEGAGPGHPRRRLRRQRAARCPRMVRQPGRVQRHRQVDDRFRSSPRSARTAASGS